MKQESHENFWNKRFGGEEYIYGKEPNSYFASQLNKLSPGHLLLPAEGEGRNAVYAAAKGWAVNAFDASEEGRKKALALASQAGIKIDYALKKASEFHDNAQYDAIALVYSHFAGQERADLFTKLENLLPTDGYLIMEVFSKNQLGRDSGGPKSKELLYSVEEIKSLFPNIRFSQLEELEISLDEGSYHSGKAMVIRAFGTKKAQ